MLRVQMIAAVLLIVFFVPSALAADERAICAVCGPREGAGFEPVKAKATHQGRQLFFCSTKCKVDFLKNPNEFLVTDSGKPAPDFSLATFEGRKFSLSEMRGKVVLLDFWATFCVPCLEALPELQALQKRYGSSGFTVVGLTIDDRAALVKKATTQAGVTYPILRSTSDVWNSYKVNALPALVLVGRDGRMIRRFGGEADKVQMRREIEKAIAEQPPGVR